MQVVNALFYGLPLDELQSFRERMNAVTVDDIQRVAKAYLRPDRLSVVLVGLLCASGIWYFRRTEQSFADVI